MKQMQTSTDPRYLLFREHKPSSTFIQNNNCASYALGNEATIQAHASRTHPLLTKPEPGDGVEIPYKIYREAFGYSVEGVIEMVEANGAILLKDNPSGKLPEVPAGYQRAAMFYFDAGRNSQYHFMREGPDGLWTHKNCEFPVRDQDPKGNLIRDPRYVSFHSYPRGPWLFAVPQDGLQMRLSQAWSELLPRLNDGIIRFKQQTVADTALARDFERAAELLEGRHDRLAGALQRFIEIASTGKLPPPPPPRPQSPPRFPAPRR